MIPHSKPTLGTDEQDAVVRVIASGMIAQGPEVDAFEHEAAAYMNKYHAIAVSSGTAALHLALAALDVQPRQPVLSPSYTCHALITAIRLQNATPVLADVDRDYNLQAQLDEDIGVVIVPHMFGAIATAPKARCIIEDVAQSMGGPGLSGATITVTSFYATKLMTTGEGGMLFTDDASIADRLRDLRDYDNRATLAPRANYKMTDIQAAMGRVQLRKLPGFLERRRELAARYLDRLAGLPLELPKSGQAVYFRFVVSTELRDALQNHLQTRGIDAKPPVFCPAHHVIDASFPDNNCPKGSFPKPENEGTSSSPKLEKQGGSFPKTKFEAEKRFPNSEKAHQTCLSLPLYPSLHAADIDFVTQSVSEFFDSRGNA